MEGGGDERSVCLELDQSVAELDEREEEDLLHSRTPPSSLLLIPYVMYFL